MNPKAAALNNTKKFKITRPSSRDSHVSVNSASKKSVPSQQVADGRDFGEVLSRDTSLHSIINKENKVFVGTRKLNKIADLSDLIQMKERPSSRGSAIKPEEHAHSNPYAFTIEKKRGTADAQVHLPTLNRYAEFPKVGPPKAESLR